MTSYSWPGLRRVGCRGAACVYAFTRAASDFCTGVGCGRCHHRARKRPVCICAPVGTRLLLWTAPSLANSRGRRAPPHTLVTSCSSCSSSSSTYSFTSTCHSCTSPTARLFPLGPSLVSAIRLDSRITQTGLLSIRRRSLIPACTHPLTALKTAPGPGVQGGGWLREALVVLRLFHARLHLGAPTAHLALLRPNLLSVGLAFTFATSVRRLPVKLRRPRYCIFHTHPRRLRPGLLDRILRPPPRPQ